MTISDFTVDMDSADSVLEAMSECLRLDEELNEEKPALPVLECVDFVL